MICPCSPQMDLGAAVVRCMFWVASVRVCASEVGRQREELTSKECEEEGHEDEEEGPRDDCQHGVLIIRGLQVLYRFVAGIPVATA